jgi:hypothetical protein
MKPEELKYSEVQATASDVDDVNTTCFSDLVEGAGIDLRKHCVHKDGLVQLNTEWGTAGQL